MARVVERNNSQMFNKSDIYPRKSQAKKFLMKELARRNILNGGPVMKMKKWDVKRLVNELEGTPPNDEDVQHIRKEWNVLKDEMRDYYHQHSGHPDVVIFRHVRMTECILHPTLRTKFIRRNNQLARHEICGRNSPKAPTSYYDDVAALFNS